MGESLTKAKRRPALTKAVVRPRQPRVIASLTSGAHTRKPGFCVHTKVATIAEILVLSAATYLVIIVTIALALAGFTTGFERYL